MSRSGKTRASAHQTKARINRLLQKGAHAEALPLLESLLQKYPDLVRERRNLASILASAGRYAEVLPHVKRLCAADPADAELARLHAFATEQAMGPAEAAPLWAEYLERHPADADATRHVVDIFRGLGDVPRAAALMDALARAHAGNLAFTLDASALWLECGDHTQAIKLLAPACERQPQNPELLNNQAIALDRAGRSLEALALLEPRAADFPNHLGLNTTLARLLEQTGAVEQAEQLYRGLLEGAPKDHPLWNELALLLSDEGRGQEAVGIVKRLLEKHPDNVGLLNNLANIESAQGDFESAQTSYRRALALDPASGDTWRNLGVSLRYGGETARQDRAAMLKQLEGLDGQSPQVMHLHFALSKLLDDIGEYDQAFAHLEQANRIAAATSRYDHAATLRQMADTAAFFANYSPPQLAQQPPAPVPVFLLGMPRSGTTLAEQKIAGRTDIFAAGELWHMVHMVRSMEAQSGKAYPACVGEQNAQSLGRFRDSYLAHLVKTAPGYAYVIDKLPINFLYLGLLKVLFPNCRIIHCRRDPMAVGLSIYRQYFPVGIEYSSDLVWIGQYIGAYQELMEQWRRLYPDFMFEFDYEHLVQDTDTLVAAMHGFIGRQVGGESASSLDNSRGIATASTWQARQPVYKSSTEKWRHYEQYLQPLAQAIKGDVR